MNLMKEAWIITADELFMLVGGLSGDSRFAGAMSDKVSYRVKKKPIATVTNFGDFMSAMNYKR